MYLIGTMNLNLKIGRLVPALFCILCWANFSYALDRDLTLDEVTKLEENAADDPKNVIARRFLIEHYSKTENWLKVSQYSQGILAELPAATLLKVTNACLEGGDGSGALAAIGAYHAKVPPTAATKTYEGLAMAKTAQKEYKDALKKQRATESLEIFKQAISQWPQEPAPYVGWIATLHEYWPNNSEDILQVYKKLENTTGEFESYLIEKCELFIKANLWDQAMVGCQRAVNKHPGDVDSQIHLAQAVKVRQGIPAGKKALEDIVAANPASAKAHFVLAEFSMEENNYIAASEHYRLAVENDKDNYEAYLGLAKAEFQLKKYEFYYHCMRIPSKAGEETKMNS